MSTMLKSALVAPVRRMHQLFTHLPSSCCARTSTAALFFKESPQQQLMLQAKRNLKYNNVTGVVRRFSSSDRDNSDYSVPPLHYEWILPPRISPSFDSEGRNSSSNTPFETQRSSVAVFLHGLLGNSRNIKSMAAKLCALRNTPGLLVDLPGHGKSSGLQRHRQQRNRRAETTTFADAAHDIGATIRAAFAESSVASHNTQLTPDTTVTMVGHSLGGRLALYYAAMSASAEAASASSSSLETTAPHQQVYHYPRPDRVWLLDTVPGIADASVVHVMEAARQILAKRKRSSSSSSGDGMISSRDELVRMLVQPEQPYGLSAATAQWLAAQFHVHSGEFSFDIAVAESLAGDFGNHDFWEQLETVTTHPPSGCPVHLVQGGKNPAWDSGAQQSRILAYAATHPDRFTHHVLPNAGHWVHIDDLPGLLAAVESVESLSAQN